jgi:tRNA-splicing ligase RtcB (3'-phosphate/5'-hydroxy nucleic acid ligase)
VIEKWVAGKLPRDVALALDRLAEASDVVHIAVMPDVHLAEDVCVGTVLATRRLLYPAAVGGDLGCGVVAVRYDAHAEVLANAGVLARLAAEIPRERRRAAALPAWPNTLDPSELSSPALAALARHDGRAQLGTLGSGNHFAELQRDDEGSLWLMLHSGSRAVGPAIRAHHTRGGTGLVSLDSETDAGRAYMSDLGWAIRYAQASRQLMVDAVTRVLDLPVVESFGCHHNHVRREDHFGEQLWVHRKGAIPAALGERGIIPGSMGSASYHTRGRGCELSLGSSSHGAGRAMSRTQARQKISARDLERQLRGVVFDHSKLDALRDEAPAAYKDIGEVMRAQRELTKVERRLTPLLAFKGS